MFSRMCRCGAEDGLEYHESPAMRAVGTPGPGLGPGICDNPLSEHLAMLIKSRHPAMITRRCEGKSYRSQPNTKIDEVDCLKMANIERSCLPRCTAEIFVKDLRRLRAPTCAVGGPFPWASGACSSRTGIGVSAKPPKSSPLTSPGHIGISSSPSSSPSSSSSSPCLGL